MTKETNIREIVLDILLEVMEKGNYSHLILSQALEKYRYLEKQDRAFIWGNGRNHRNINFRLDAVIDRFFQSEGEKNESR